MVGIARLAVTAAASIVGAVFVLTVLIDELAEGEIGSGTTAESSSLEVIAGRSSNESSPTNQSSLAAEELL